MRQLGLPTLKSTTQEFFTLPLWFDLMTTLIFLKKNCQGNQVLLVLVKKFCYLIIEALGGSPVGAEFLISEMISHCERGLIWLNSEKKKICMCYSLGIKNGSSKCTWILEITGQQNSTSQLFSRKLTVGVVRNPDCYWKHHCYKDGTLIQRIYFSSKNIRTSFICHDVKNIHNKYFSYL